MNSILSLFLNDHRRCDRLFSELDQAVAIADMARADQACRAFRQAMEAHFAAEEEELFPAFERFVGSIASTTALMCAEHREMRALMDRMGGAVAVGDTESYVEQAQALHALLDRHAYKEDHILYALCDERLGEVRARLCSALAHMLPG